MILADWVMLSLPIVSLIGGIKKGQLDEPKTFWFGFFCASLIALAIYAQGSDSGLTWLKSGS
jgi:hypothetical protein